MPPVSWLYVHGSAMAPESCLFGQVYTMVSHVVSEHTCLLYGRHLDQIILCALYGVCKVNQLKQITFKDIITHYKKQAQAKNSIFRTVSIQLTPDLQVGPPCILQLRLQ